MTQRTLVVTCLLVVCAGRVASGQSPRPERVTRLGAADAFGPGITAVSAGGVQFQLARPAHVIVLRVGQDGSIEPIVPRAGEPTQYDIGLHGVAGPPLDEARASPVREPVLRSAEALARTGRRAPPPGADLGDSVITPHAFWLVVVSDVATSASEVRARLQAMKLDFSSVKAELEALPKALVGKRAGSWAAYYAGTK
jgi:hypothetical protein